MLSKLANPYTIRGLLQRPELYPLVACIGGASALCVTYTTWCLVGKADVTVNRWRSKPGYEIDSIQRRGQPFLCRDQTKYQPDPAQEARDKLLQEIRKQ